MLWVSKAKVKVSGSMQPMGRVVVTYLSGGCEGSGLRVAGWGWCPVVHLVVSPRRVAPGWKLDFLSVQILEKVPCF